MPATPVMLGTRYACHALKGDPLVTLDFFENAMVHPRMKVQALGSPKLPLVEEKFFKKSVGKLDLFS